MRLGWSGVFVLTRNVWDEDSELKMAPIKERESLQKGHIAHSPAKGEDLKVRDGNCCRIKGVWSGKEKAGFAVRVNDEKGELTEIYYSPEEKKLILDATRSGSESGLVREEAPLELKEGEQLSLDIFIDRAVIEVYANKRQAICRRVYPTDPKNSTGVRLIGQLPQKLDSYQMFPTNPY